MELYLLVLLGLFIIPAILAAFASDILRAAIALAACSVGLAILLFSMGASLAAVFELSVCAGLITVLFVNTISLARPVQEEERSQKSKEHYFRFSGVWLVAIVVAVLLWSTQGTWLGWFSFAKENETLTVGEILWQQRGLDLIGQVAMILVGVFGVVVLFKRGKMNA
jgi:NADH-quinone oxidoreductase subunit J